MDWIVSGGSGYYNRSIYMWVQVRTINGPDSTDAGMLLGQFEALPLQWKLVAMRIFRSRGVLMHSSLASCSLVRCALVMLLDVWR